VNTTVLKAGPLTEGQSHKGVVFYPPTFVRVTYVFSVRIDSLGNVVGTEQGTPPCEPVREKEEVTIMPDLERPMLLRNASSALSGSKFGVTLNNGMLASVNVETTETASQLLTPVGTVLAAAFAVPAAVGPPACNAGSRVQRFEPIRLQD
jgi:hypothetical protein